MRKQTNSTNRILSFFSRPYRYAVLFSLILTSAFIFTLLDAFVIPRALQPVQQQMEAPQASYDTKRPSTMDGADSASNSSENTENTGNTEYTEGSAQADPAVTAALPNPQQDTSDKTQADSDAATESPYAAEDQEDKTQEVPFITDVPINQTKDPEDTTQAAPALTAVSYKDSDIEISIEILRAYSTDIYIANIKLSNAAYLKTAFANDTYGRNFNEKTSDIANRQNAIFAVNGDYYGFRDDGWVLRNGVLYRSGDSDDALLMDMEGYFSCNRDKTAVEEKVSGLWQIWSFGPPLVVDGAISVKKDQEISGRSSNSNPRTAIGQAGKLHYVFIVSDGRTDMSAGLSLYELAALFEERGCSVAYNLDGGGSSAMYFNGQVINKPTTEGRRIREREVSDIVYIGY